MPLLLTRPAYLLYYFTQVLEATAPPNQTLNPELLGHWQLHRHAPQNPSANLLQASES